MPWAISAASSSGCLISWMLSWMLGLLVIRPRWRRRRSASGAAAADDDARAGGVHVDAQPVTGALDLDPAHRGGLELGHQVVADLPVLDDRVLVAAVVEPARLPVGRDAEAEPVGVDLLAHQSLSSSVVGGVGRRRRLRVVRRLVGRFALVGPRRSSSRRRRSASSVFDLVVSPVASSASTSSRLGDVGSTVGLDVVGVVGSSTAVDELVERLVVGGSSRPSSASALAARRRVAGDPAGPPVGRPRRRRAPGGGRARSSGMRARMTVMWQVRLRMRVARPRARGRQRFIVVPSSA